MEQNSIKNSSTTWWLNLRNYVRRKRRWLSTAWGNPSNTLQIKWELPIRRCLPIWKITKLLQNTFRGIVKAIFQYLCLSSSLSVYLGKIQKKKLWTPIFSKKYSSADSTMSTTENFSVPMFWFRTVPSWLQKWQPKENKVYERMHQKVCQE